MALQELADTESRLTRFLDLLSECFLEEVKHEASELHVLGLAVTQLRRISEWLWTRFTDSTSACETLSRSRFVLIAFSDYAALVDDAQSCFRKIDRSKTKLLQDNPRLQGQSFLSLSIMPVQRVPRYLLLLKEIKKTACDETLIDAAIEEIHEAAEAMELRIKKKEDMDKVSALVEGIKDSSVREKYELLPFSPLCGLESMLLFRDEEKDGRMSSLLLYEDKMICISDGEVLVDHSLLNAQLKADPLDSCVIHVVLETQDV